MIFAKVYSMKKLLILCALILLSETYCDTISVRQDFFCKTADNPAAAKSFLQNKDPEIRRYALYLLLKHIPGESAAALEAAVRDSDEQVRLTAIKALAKNPALHPQGNDLLKKAANSDKSRQIRQIAVAASWPFQREIKLLRNDPSWDYEVKVIKTVALEKLPWRFATDPLQDGHNRGFFKVDFDTSKWSPIKMGVWENQGFADYDGVTWYQIKFKMPPKMDCNAVEIAFDAVDESAWVWLNGVYLGAHDIGPEGWREPFAVSCTKEIKWNAENILTVRVYDAAFAGGIYKPLRVEILK